MGIKDFILKKQMERQLKNMPEQQKEMFRSLMENHSGLMEKIAGEVKERKDKGQDEHLAGIAVMKKYQGEIQKAITGK